MKVSIIMPTHNSEKSIHGAIESIKEQTYTNWELLITDDASSDSTVQCINKYCHEDHRIKLYRLHDNMGAGIARNNSIQKSTGRFIAFCDSDDIWLKNKLSCQIEFMLKNSIQLCYSPYFISINGNLTAKMNAPSKLTYSDLIKCNYIGCLTAIYDKKKIGKCYMPSIRKRQDWLLWLSIISKTEGATCFDKPLAIYSASGENSLSSNKLGLILYTYRVYREFLNKGIIGSVIYTIRYQIYNRIKKIYYVTKM